MRVLVLTTSYPRHAGDPAGGFVADAVERVRAAGVDVEVVAPTAFRHFGLAYGDGMLPVTERVAASTLALPFYAQLEDDDIAYVASALREVLAEQ